MVFRLIGEVDTSDFSRQSVENIATARNARQSLLSAIPRDYQANFEFILFGSTARGTARDETDRDPSDTDLVLAHETFEELSIWRVIFMRINDLKNKRVEVVVRHKSDVYEGPEDFDVNVRREGILLD